MASFKGLSDDVIKAAKSCAGNIDKADMASFVMAQYDLIRDEAYAAKIEGQNKESQTASVSGKKAVGDANSAFSRLQNMLKSQGQ